MNGPLLAAVLLSATLGGCGASAPTPRPPPIGAAGGDQATPDIPRTGGANATDATPILPTALVEGVLDRGEQRWYRYEPPLGGGSYDVRILSRQLIHGTYQVHSAGNLTLISADGTEVGTAEFQTAATLADAAFAESTQPNVLATDAALLKISLGDGDSPSVHFKVDIKPR